MHHGLMESPVRTKQKSFNFYSINNYLHLQIKNAIAMRKTMIALSIFLCTGVYSQQAPAFNGLDMNLGNLSRLSDAKTRSISPENFTGAKGKGGMADPSLDSGKRNVANAWHAAKDLGKGWKENT